MNKHYRFHFRLRSSLSHPKMIVGCRSPLPMLLLLLPLCCTEPNYHQRAHSSSNSVRLARRILTRVRALLLQYKLEELGDSEFEDRSLSLQDLPSLKTDYFHWLHMQDSERLRGAVQGLKVFWHHLDLKRQQLKQECRGRPGRLTRSMQKLIQVSHADSSLSNHELPMEAPLTEAPPPTPSFWARLAWHKRLEGYVVLRDLERYLRRLVRDFMLLKARRSTAQPSGRHLCHRCC
uniref:Ciliary neurotrophic factor n=1 Tax=Paramormyrops kingsleyae TaxID=1676925 RepID=A0A3B3QEF9_9TELE